MPTKTPLVLAIDFDQTISHNTFPDLGAPIAGARECIMQLKRDGHYIIIWTCRFNTQEVGKWLDKHGIPYDTINEHNPLVVEFFGNDTRKISADLYIDDKNINGLPPWSEIYQIVTQKCAELQHKLLDFLFNK